MIAERGRMAGKEERVGGRNSVSGDGVDELRADGVVEGGRRIPGAAADLEIDEREDCDRGPRAQYQVHESRVRRERHPAAHGDRHGVDPRRGVQHPDSLHRSEACDEIGDCGANGNG